MHIKNVTALILIPAILLTAIIMFFYRADNEINVSNLDYIKSCGLSAEEKCADIAYFRIPEEFDSVFSAYNDIIKSGGFDLTPYRGERVVRYSYIITNHSGSDNRNMIRANIILCDNKMIAADISSLASDGFIEALIPSE